MADEGFDKAPGGGWAHSIEAMRRSTDPRRRETSRGGRQAGDETALPQIERTDAAPDRPAQIRTYLQLGERDLKDAGKAWRIIEDDVDGLLDEFYAEALRSEMLPALAAGEIARLKASQKCHWARLFSSDGADGVVWDRARRMGLRHRQYDLTPFTFTTSYMKLLILFFEALRRSGRAEARDLHHDCMAITKVVALDLALALGAYDAELID